WLRTVVSRIPTAEVESFALLWSNLASAQFIGEIGASTNMSLVARNGLEPPYWTLKKGVGRHEETPTSYIHRLDDSVGKSHIMEGWQPSYGDAVRCEFQGMGEICRIMEKVPVTDHHTLRDCRGTRSVLEQSQRIAAHRRMLPFLR